MTIIAQNSDEAILTVDGPALNVDGELIEILFRLDARNGCFVSNVCFLRRGERNVR